MRLTFLINSMTHRAGMERVTATVASGLARRGMQVQVITVYGQSSAFELDPAVEVTHLNMPPDLVRLRSLFTPLVRALRKDFRRWRPDLVVVVDSVMSMFAFPASVGLGVRRVVWEHFHLHYEYGLRQRRVTHWLSAHLGHDVVTLTEQDAVQWRQLFPHARARVRAIANPLPFAVPASNPYRPDSRTVLAVGRLTDQKGFDLLLQAWAQVEPLCPEWRLRVVGDGELHASLLALGERLGLRRWTLEPATGQVEALYRQAGVYALSSRHEGLPMVLMESQAYGVPAVAFDCLTGPADLLGPGGGLLVEAGRPDAFAVALQRVLNDEALRAELSASAYRNSVRYEAPRILDQWAAFVHTHPRRSPRMNRSTHPSSA